MEHEGREWERSVFTAVTVGIRDTETGAGIGKSGIGSRKSGKAGQGAIAHVDEGNNGATGHGSTPDD